jgi:hypothetical protein
MATNIFLSKEISKFTKANKKEILLMVDLISYLTVANEISLQEATQYSNMLFNILDE